MKFENSSIISYTPPSKVTTSYLNMNFGFFSFLKPKSLVSFVIYISPHLLLHFLIRAWISKIKMKMKMKMDLKKSILVLTKFSFNISILVPNICVSISINITSKIILIIQETENHYNTNRLS